MEITNKTVKERKVIDLWVEVEDAEPFDRATGIPANSYPHTVRMVPTSFMYSTADKHSTHLVHVMCQYSDAPQASTCVSMTLTEEWASLITPLAPQWIRDLVEEAVNGR